MTDPWLYDGQAEAGQLADAMRAGPAEAEAAAVAMYRRAYLGHGDQLSALEAEAYAHTRARPGGAGACLRRALAALFRSSP